MKTNWIAAGVAVSFLAACRLAAGADLASSGEAVPAPAAAEAYLSKSRVKVTVTWRSPYDGSSGTATAVPQGDEFAYFAFSSASNPEVFVKVLGSNDPSWLQLFAAGLTTFEYTVTFAGCGQTRSWKKDAYARATYDEGQGFPIAGCQPWPNEVTVTLPGGVPLVMVKIPAGTFSMGSPATEKGRDRDETLHAVTLTQEYYVGKYLVTQEQWQAVMGTNPSNFGSCGGRCPVETVSWDDIRGTNGFIEKLNGYLASTGQAGAGKFRLPTEAEWERAARGGTQTRFSFGDALAGDDFCVPNAEAEPYVWWCNNSRHETHPVGTKLANPYGLFDVHGNVWEWVEDWFGSYPAGAVTDPTGPSSGSYRVLRGGSLSHELPYCRSAFRSNFYPSYRIETVGFRLARSL